MKKLILIFFIIIIILNINIYGFCNDENINNKLNKFINNEIDSKYILSYLDCNYSNIENRKMKKIILNKFILYNEKCINDYQKSFDDVYINNVKNLQTKQNLKSELNMLNDKIKYNEIQIHKFKFIDNKPELLNKVKQLYLSGYKIIIKDNKFKLKVNYKLLNNT